MDTNNQIVCEMVQTKKGKCVRRCTDNVRGGIYIPDGTVEIGEGAFSFCEQLNFVMIPESVRIIGESAFEKCSSLRTVNIPNGVTTIADSAFSGCSSLSVVTIPDSVTKLEKYAFHNCTSLNFITIPESVKEIEACALTKGLELSDFLIEGFDSLREVNRIIKANFLDLIINGKAGSYAEEYCYENDIPFNEIR